MRAGRLASFIVVAVLLLSSAARADGIGVVLMHGKEGTPDRAINLLAGAIEAAGFPVERPSMCFARQRIYDRPFLDCFADIDAAIARVRARGATRIVIAGQSLGGATALAYAARHDGLAGIVALAPAPSPNAARRPEIAQSLERARAQVASGHGGDAADFADINAGTPLTVHTTAAIYLTFLAPDGPAMAIAANTAQLKAPLLWVAGTKDPGQPGPEWGFAHAPPNPLNRYVTVDAAHLATPDAAREAVVGWLKDLAKQR